MSTPRLALVPGVLLIAALTATWLSWPLVLDPGGWLVVAPADPDVQAGMWWPQAFASSLLGGEPPFQRPELLWPHGQDTRLLLWNFLPQLLMLPLVGLGPVEALNLSTLLWLTLDGCCAAGGAWLLTRKATPTLLAAALGAASTYALWEGMAGRPEQALWGPIALTLGALARLIEVPGERRSLLAAGLGLALAGATYWFYALFLVLLTALAGAVLLASSETRGRHLRDGLVVAAIAGVAVLPFLVPILSALLDGGEAFRSAVELHDPAVQRRHASLVLPDAALGGLARDLRDPASVLPLSALLGLLAAAAFGGKALRLLAGAGLLAALFSLGDVLVGPQGEPRSFGHSWLSLPHALLAPLPGMARFWWPYRWLAVALSAGILCLSWACSRLPRAPIAALLVGGLALVEAERITHNPRLQSRFSARPQAAWLALGRLGGERPITLLPHGEGTGMYVTSAWHHQPMDSGVGWEIALAARGDEDTAYRASVPLLADLDEVMAGERRPARAEYTVQSGGGFHYVWLDRTARPRQDMVQTEEALRMLLGPPLVSDPIHTLWAVPGVGEAPTEGLRNPPGLPGWGNPLTLGGSDTPAPP